MAEDLIKNELVFIEVKTRSNFKYGNPADAVDKQKRRHMVQAIRYYLYKNHIQDVAIRVDVLEVYIVQSCEINHIKQIL